MQIKQNNEKLPTKKKVPNDIERDDALRWLTTNMIYPLFATFGLGFGVIPRNNGNGITTR
jgi:hypothetical protein